MKKIITIVQHTTEGQETKLDAIGFYTYFNSDKEYSFEPYKNVYSVHELHITLKQLEVFFNNIDYVIETIS